METILRFNGDKQKVILTPDYDVTDYSDIEFGIENINTDDPDNPVYAYVKLKEHEAVYLANEILRFVEMNHKDNIRWNEDEEKKKNR